MVNGVTEIIAHIGFPTHAFKAPLIYNPWFERAGVNAIVLPMSCRAEDFSDFFRAIFKLTNTRGAIITMPHKVAATALVDELLSAASIAGACNAVRRGPDGRLQGEMFDGEGFVRGVRRKGLALRGCRALVVGSGGVGSAIAASLAAAEVRELLLFDVNSNSSEHLAERLRKRHPALRVKTGTNDPAGLDLVVNATPLGMQKGDQLPVDVSRLASRTFVGEVVMRTEITEFLAAAKARGCAVQIGSDMLFEQIPAYLEFFGFPTTTPDVLRSIATLIY
jgi:shikimate dehydrogenase